MQMGQSRIPVSPSRTRVPVYPSHLPTTPPPTSIPLTTSNSPSLGIRQVASPATHDVRLAGNTPRARTRRPSEMTDPDATPMYRVISGTALPITPSTSGETDGMSSPKSSATGLTRRPADRRRPSGASGVGETHTHTHEGLSPGRTSLIPRRISGEVDRPTSGSPSRPRRPSAHVDTSSSTLNAHSNVSGRRPSTPGRTKKHSTRSTYVDTDVETSSIRSGHPSASTSKAGTPIMGDAEEYAGFPLPNGYEPGMARPDFGSGSRSASGHFETGSRLPVPKSSSSSSRPGSSRKGSSSSSIHHRQQPDHSRPGSSRSDISNSSSSRLSAHGRDERLMNNNIPGNIQSRPPTPSPIGSPSRSVSARTGSAQVVPPLPQKLEYGRGSPSGSPRGSTDNLTQAGMGSRLPLLGPVINSGGRRKSSDRERSRIGLGTGEGGVEQDRWLYGREIGSGSRRPSGASSPPMSPTRIQPGLDSALSTSPPQPYYLGAFVTDASALVIPDRRSSIPSNTTASFNPNTGVVDLNSPDLGGPDDSSASHPVAPSVSPRMSSLPTSTRIPGGRSNTSSGSSSPIGRTPTGGLTGLGISTGYLSGRSSGQTSPVPIPAKSPARAKTPSGSSQSGHSRRDKEGLLAPAPPGTYRTPESRGGVDVLESPGGKRSTGLESEGETVGQRRNQPDLRIDPPVPPMLDRSSRSSSTGTMLQPPPGPSRTSSQGSVGSATTRYATPPTTISGVPLQPVDASAILPVNNLAAGSMYTRVGSGDTKDGPTPPIPARNPLRRRASTKDGSSLTTSRTGTPNESRTGTPKVEQHGDSKFDPRPQESQTGDAGVASDPRDTIVSVYSQPSAQPFSAASAVSSGSEATIGPGPSATSMNKRDLRIDVASRATGAKTGGQSPTTADMVRVMGFAAELEAESSAPRANRTGSQVPDIRKTLPDTPEEEDMPRSGLSEQGGRLRDERYRYPQRGESIIRHSTSQSQLPSPSKSPSMPNFACATGAAGPASLSTLSLQANSAAMPRERPALLSRPSRPPMVHTRSQSSPVSPLINVSGTPPLLSPTSMTPTTRMTKRAHLIHEICSTERSYANDLALIRDVYLLKVGPSSAHSMTSTFMSKSSGWTSPGEQSGGSRLSAYTVESSMTSRTTYESSMHAASKLDLNDVGVPNDNTVRPDFGRSASITSNGAWPGGSAKRMSGLYSASSDTTQAVPAPRRRLTVSEALSPSDTRTLFINLEQLAAFADELATSFERALGDATGAEPVLKEGQEDLITDRLGEVFLNVIPKITNMYTTYCARQAQANTRLLELMQDTKTANYLQTCWTSIQPFTNAWDLGSMLIKPVQRVMKYPLLFGDLLHCTSPVHPDYFNLRKAFEGATSIAGEINEVKRRKDVVERIISKDSRKRPTTTGSVSGNKDVKVFGMSAKFREKFGKSKDKDKAAPTTAMVGSTASLTVIVPGSERQLYELIGRLDAADQVVRKVGKEINMWPDKVRDTWQAQKNMMISWTSVVRLDGSDFGDERIDMYGNMVDDLMDRPWMQLDDDVRNTVMPMFSTLLRLGVNPKRLVQKREARLTDYTRFQSARSKSDVKALDKSVVQGAEDFVALHTQLLEELPAYIDGYSKILELALAQFANAQARFYDSVRNKLREYLLLWTAAEEAEYHRAGVRDLEIEVLDGQRIVKGWHECWKPFMQQIEALRISHPGMVRTVPSSRVPSQASSQAPSAPQLMRGPTPPVRPTEPPSVNGNRSRSTSFLTKRKDASRPSSIVSEAPFPSPRPSDITDRDFPNMPSPQLSSSTGGRTMGPRPTYLVPPHPYAHSQSQLRSPSSSDPHASPNFPFESPGGTPRDFLMNSPNIGDDGNFLEWTDQTALYQCACVADFKLGMEIWYAGLPFLQMEEGDVVDILNEVGRVDQLADIPIDVGVPDDGLLVGKSMNGVVGLILCSFLEPLR